MIKIKTYISSDDEEFIPIEEFFYSLDESDYKIGAIEIEVDNVILVSTDISTTAIDFLWAWLVIAFKKILNAEESIARTTYPGTSCYLILEKNIEKKTIKLISETFSKRLRKNVLEEQYDVVRHDCETDYYDFVNEFIHAGKVFFSCMDMITPNSRKGYRSSFNDLVEIEKSIYK